MTPNKRILFMGTPAFAVASLNALIDAHLDVAAVVTAPDRPAGRGRQLRMSPVKERAIQLGLPVLQPVNLKDSAFHAALDEINAALFVVVAFRMLPAAVWQRPGLGTVNLHASLLPDYRGAAPINWALINGETRTGLTTFLINGNIDTGDILLREHIKIMPEDNFGTLHDRMMNEGAVLLARTVKDILDGTTSPIPQARFEGERLHDAPKLTPANCKIDWAKDATHINDQVRGLAPAPGAWAWWQEEGQERKQVKVLRSRPSAAHHRHAPGTVTIAGDRLTVQCGTGSLEVTELQMPGKKAMDAGAFLRGLHRRTGIILG